MYDFRVVRTLRQQQNLTLENLSSVSGLSYPTIALIETNKSFPSLKTLDALAKALDTSVSTLISMAERNLIKRGSAKPVTPQLLKASEINLESLLLVNFNGLRLLRITFKKGEVINSNKFHDDNACYEFCYCLSGSIKIKIMDDAFHLRDNDVIIFDGSSTHEYTAVEKSECLVIHLPTESKFMDKLIKN